jgi:hypothetical protein
MAGIIIPYKHVFQWRLPLAFGDNKTIYFHLVSTEMKDKPMDRHPDQEAVACVD